MMCIAQQPGFSTKGHGLSMVENVFVIYAKGQALVVLQTVLL
jgi:hypothetical protein